MFVPFKRSANRPPEPGEFARDLVRGFDVVRPRERRSRRSELVLAIGWILIALKCWLVTWACRTYAVPVHPGWIVWPTLLFAAVCTGLYLRRH